MSRYKFVATSLDPDLLLTSFRVQTNWHVLTGAACCGKTTLADGLAERGFRIIPESARQYFETEMRKGRTLDEIRRDGAGLQRGIAALQLRFERDCQAAAMVFLDRAIPDSLTFYRVYGMDPNEILPACFYHRYAAIFLLDRLPFHRQGTLGPEDDVTSAFLNAWLARDYSALGYDVVRVPVLPPEERLAFILSRLQGTGWANALT